MTRVEAFVASAFAFAVTMLVITVGTIPENFDELLLASKQIPSFAASFAIMTWIWHSHTVWSRRYGLEDTTTIYLSASLIFLVLIYVYPLRIMMQSLFASMSDGFLPYAMEFDAYWQIRYMFAFYAIGFLLLSVNFVALYLHALRLKAQLKLTDFELFDTRSETLFWSATALVCIFSLSFSLLMPRDYLPLAGYSLFALFPLLTGLGFYRSSQRKKRFAEK